MIIQTTSAFSSTEVVPNLLLDDAVPPLPLEPFFVPPAILTMWLSFLLCIHKSIVISWAYFECSTIAAISQIVSFHILFSSYFSSQTSLLTWNLFFFFILILLSHKHLSSSSIWFKPYGLLPFLILGSRYLNSFTLSSLTLNRNDNSTLKKITLNLESLPTLRASDNESSLWNKNSLLKTFI